MNDLRALLSNADPVRTEPALSTDEAQSMRARVLDAASIRTSRSFPWRSAVAVAALVVMMIGGWAVAGRRLVSMISVAPGPPMPPGSTEVAERLQVQFATPGGTRIIWTINPDFRGDKVLK